MNSLERVTLQRIIAYLSDIREYTEDCEFDQFLNDKKTVYACLFCMAQIAKLVAEKDLASETKKEYKKIDWAKLRNLLNGKCLYGRNIHRLRRYMALCANNLARYKKGFGEYLNAGSA